MLLFFKAKISATNVSQSEAELKIQDGGAYESRLCTCPRSDLRRIYTTFILGTALLNFGPPGLHGKICSSFFNVDF